MKRDMMNFHCSCYVLPLILVLSLVISSCSSTSKKKITSDNHHVATQQVVSQYGPKAEKSLIPYFKRAQVAYPPQQVSMLTFKDERKVELWAKDTQQNWQYIRTYPMTAMSGKPGPKLREFDLQIPEGVYNITDLNPFSKYHLSMMINYPNQFDQEYAKKDGRTQLGNHIFIHGKADSVGCIAIGDKAINELFVLVARIGTENARVIIAPNDLRHQSPLEHPELPQWTPVLYAKLNDQLQAFV